MQNIKQALADYVSSAQAGAASLILIGQGSSLEMAEGVAAKILDTESLSIHPDFMLLGADNAPLGVEEAAAITSRAKLMPAVASHIVIVVDGMERMTPQAQNKLLKVLEESTTTVLIGVAYEDKILDTIKSRCIVLRPQSAGEEVPADVAEVFTAMDAVSKPEELFSVLHLVREKDAKAFPAAHKEYMPELFEHLARLYGDDLEIRSICIKNRANCTSIAYTKDSFFRAVMDVVERRKAHV